MCDAVQSTKRGFYFFRVATADKFDIAQTICPTPRQRVAVHKIAGSGGPCKISGVCTVVRLMFHVRNL